MGKRDFYKTFAQAKYAAHAFHFVSAIDYRCRRTQCDNRLHSNPQVYYRDDWQGWHDFLGTTPATEKLYQDYQTAKRVASQANFKNARAYKLFCKTIDERLPKVPEQFYAKAWQGWADFLNINEKSYYATYQQAQQATRALAISSSLEYFAKRKEFDEKLPPSPIKFYAKEWLSWYDFLGTKKEDTLLYPDYASAQKAAQQFQFSSASDYQKRAKQCDVRLPCKPKEKYADAWQGWAHFLTTTRRDNACQHNFSTLKRLVHAQRFASINEYVSKRHYIAEDLPILPNEIYPEWQGWQDFLGPSYRSNNLFTHL